VCLLRLYKVWRISGTSLGVNLSWAPILYDHGSSVVLCGGKFHFCCGTAIYSYAVSILLLLLFIIMRSSDPYKAKSPLDIELVNG